jgi:hypothetical protein
LAAQNDDMPQRIWQAVEEVGGVSSPGGRLDSTSGIDASRRAVISTAAYTSSAVADGGGSAAAGPRSQGGGGGGSSGAASTSAAPWKRGSGSTVSAATIIAATPWVSKSMSWRGSCLVGGTLSGRPPNASIGSR